MTLTIQELQNAIEKAWGYGYAEGILRGADHQERDVVRVLSQVLLMVAVKSEAGG